MKIKFNSLICSILFPVIFISGLFYLTYNPQIVPIVGAMGEPFLKEGVFVSAKAYTPRESVRYLHRDLTLNGIQPVQITIQNNTDKTYFISEKGVLTPHHSAKRVSFCVLRSAIHRSIALKIAGFFFWPFIIPSAVDTLITWRCHAKIMHEYGVKGLKEESEILTPYSTVTRVLFMPKKKFAQKVALLLYEKQTHRTISLQAST